MSHKYFFAGFENDNEAVDAFNTLVGDYDFANEDISIITTESVKERFEKKTGKDVNDEDDIGVGEGAAAGAVAGGLIGLVVSAVPLAIAGLPSLIIVGPIAAALGLSGVAGTTTTGALAGAVTGGLVGVLDNLGMSKDDAKEYERIVNEKGVILIIDLEDRDEDELKETLSNLGADEIRIVNAAK